MRSRFLELPAELRVQIYDYLLPSHNTIDSTQPIGRLCFLRTCRQVYNEAKNALYERRTFKLAISGYGTTRNAVVICLAGSTTTFHRVSEDTFLELRLARMQHVEIDLYPGSCANSVCDVQDAFMWVLQRMSSDSQLKRFSVNIIYLRGMLRSPRSHSDGEIISFFSSPLKIIHQPEAQLVALTFTNRTQKEVERRLVKNNSDPILHARLTGYKAYYDVLRVLIHEMEPVGLSSRKARSWLGWMSAYRISGLHDQFDSAHGYFVKDLTEELSDGLNTSASYMRRLHQRVAALDNAMRTTRDSWKSAQLEAATALSRGT